MVSDRLICDTETFRFVGKQEISRLTGLSGETLKKYRLKGRLIEDIHWVRVNQTNVRYNLPLVKDWFCNINNPMAHQAAIEAYLAGLAVNQNTRRKRSHPTA